MFLFVSISAFSFCILWYETFTEMRKTFTKFVEQISYGACL